MRTPSVLLVSAFIALLVDVAVAAGVIYRTWGYVSAALVACTILAYCVSARPPRARASTSQQPAIHGGIDGRERMLQAYAESVAKSLRGLYGRSCAFVLVATPLGEAPAAVQYVSNLERSDGTELLRRLFASWQTFGRNADPAGSRGDAPIDLTLAKPSIVGSMWRVLEYTHDAVILWQMDGAGIVYWNQAAEALYGYGREEVRGQVTHTLLKTIPSGTGIAELEEKLSRFGVWVGELRHTARDGRQILVESRLSLMAQDDGGWLVLELNRDITDRTGAEQTRRAAQRQLSALRSRVECA